MARTIHGYAQSLDDFDPNASKRDTPYATYCPGRQPRFKPHSTRAHALAALAHQPYGILYAFENDQWVEALRKNPEGHPPECERCRQPEGNHVYLRMVLAKHRGKLVEPLAFRNLCTRCRSLNR